MYRIVLACDGVPPSAGAEAAVDITNEFVEHRPWWNNARCTWDGTRLVLQADSENDSSAPVLTDEFSDALSACVAELFDGEITLESVVEVPPAAP